jgi:DnaJ-class molecular chaperone
MAKKDYYKTLGINRTASEKEIKQAYRQMARKLHPDVNPGDKTAEAKFKEVNEANDVLSDPEKRKKYDQYGDMWEHADQFTRQNQSAPWGQQQGSTYTSSDFGDAGDLGSIFENLFQGSGSSRRPAKPKSIQHNVEVTLEEAYHGTSRLLQMQAEEVCPACAGTGHSGKTRGRPCADCGGAGSILRPKRIEVKIPPGVGEGSKIRLAGEGSTGPGGVKGDLYLVIQVLPHQAFERKGDDLYTDVTLPLYTAVLGGEVQLTTLNGKLALKIPPETQNGKVFRLSGKGMPHLGNPSSYGDLFAKAAVELPSQLTQQEKKLYEQLRALRP